MCSKRCAFKELEEELNEKLPMWNVVAWSALISGYTQLGQADAALGLHRKMQNQGVVPDLVTLVALLAARNHIRLLEEREELFEMWDVVHLVPKLEHYTRMVDLFG
jgi:pentatricopeptide repeat protein